MTKEQIEGILYGCYHYKTILHVRNTHVYYMYIGSIAYHLDL